MSQLSRLVFFSSEKELFSWIYSLKKTPRRTKVLIVPVWNNIWDTLFELIQTDVQCSKSYFNFFLPQEAGAFGNNMEKEPQKLPPKLKKAFILFINREYLLCLQSNNASDSFLHKNINFLEQWFSHFEVSVIP